MWNKSGNALLVLAFTDFDVTNQVRAAWRRKGVNGFVSAMRTLPPGLC